MGMILYNGPPTTIKAKKKKRRKKKKYNWVLFWFRGRERGGEIEKGKGKWKIEKCVLKICGGSFEKEEGEGISSKV